MNDGVSRETSCSAWKGNLPANISYRTTPQRPQVGTMVNLFPLGLFGDMYATVPRVLPVLVR